MARVLLVDDNDSIRRLVFKVLEREGITVDQACDGVEAIEKLRVQDYDLTILDLMMPRATGFDVLASVYAREPTALRKIIVMTAAAAHVNNDLLSGVRQVVTKPFLIEEMRALVLEVLADSGHPVDR